MTRPQVVVIIPCYNHGAFVGDAVASCHAQRDADVRIIIINDGSDDGFTPAACDVLAGERVRVIHQDNRGLPAARNRGLRESESEFVVFLDADDWLEPTFISRLHGELAAARAGPEGDHVSHAYCQERLVELGTGIWRVPPWDPLLLMITNLHPVTTLVRRECLEAVGGFDETMRGGYEDWDLWLKFAQRGWRGVRIAEPLFVWRRHSHTTMVMEVIHNHEALYRGLMSRHAAMYAAHRADLLARMNSLMRRFDANWLDEMRTPINLAALREAPAMYESMFAVRLQRRLERVRGPLGAASRAMLRLTDRLIPRPGVKHPPSAVEHAAP